MGEGRAAAKTQQQTWAHPAARTLPGRLALVPGAGTEQSHRCELAVPAAPRLTRFPEPRPRCLAAGELRPEAAAALEVPLRLRGGGRARPTQTPEPSPRRKEPARPRSRERTRPLCPQRSSASTTAKLRQAKAAGRGERRARARVPDADGPWGQAPHGPGDAAVVSAGRRSPQRTQNRSPSLAHAPPGAVRWRPPSLPGRGRPSVRSHGREGAGPSTSRALPSLFPRGRAASPRPRQQVARLAPSAAASAFPSGGGWRGGVTCRAIGDRTGPQWAGLHRRPGTFMRLTDTCRVPPRGQPCP